MRARKGQWCTAFLEAKLARCGSTGHQRLWKLGAAAFFGLIWFGLVAIRWPWATVQPV